MTSDRIAFKLNGINCSVGSETSSDLSLVDYIRNVAELRGTKYMCREGGCGACIVSVVKSSGATPEAVNSCLVSVTSCQGWEITTVEKVGNRLKGYHDIQTELVRSHGTQCGYCTPGWVMSMYSFLQKNKKPTMLEIEKAFGSNICRCTGYRPILEAFKTFAKDNPNTDGILDIEDLNICNKTGKQCNKNECDEDDWCILSKEDVATDNSVKIKLKDGRFWFKVSTLLEVAQVFFVTGNNDSYMLVNGNTAKGAYPIDKYPQILIDISGVSALKGYLIDQNLRLGAGNTLSEILDIFETVSQREYFGYLKKFINHINLVAHIPVRNLGTIAGNLMIKHAHNEFPSDIFLLLATVGAQLTILNTLGLKQYVSMQQFLKVDMKFKVILNVLLPPLNDQCHIVTFKIMPRAQSAHAIVNAGFFYKLRSKDNKILQSRLIYGGLSPSFNRASETEKFLLGRILFTNDTLQGALKVLEKDLVVVDLPPEPSVEYRRKLSLGLFYKGLLKLYPYDTLDPTVKSGAIDLHEIRPVSDARQIFDTNPSLWPLNQPMKKREALIQCSGESEYAEDIPAYPREVFGAFVLSTVPSGSIDNIDSSKALAHPGVVAFYTAKDIPGLNSFTPAEHEFYTTNEEVLCSGQVKYFNQPLAIVVAESRYLAEYATNLVVVTYSNVTTPVVDFREAIKDEKRRVSYNTSEATYVGTGIVNTIKGSNLIGGQYHMCMETLLCVCRPKEDGLEVYSTTQWLDGTQLMISRALNMDINRVDVFVRRLGGAYGIKISRGTQAAVGCSLVAKTLNRPCRFIQSLTTNMRAVGKRYSSISEYEVGIDASGAIQKLDYTLYEENGYTINEKLSLFTLDSFFNCYMKDRFNFKGFDVTTDVAKHTFCRAPGTFESIAMAELLMEQISYAQSLDPIKVRLANLDTTNYNDLTEMVETIKSYADFDSRKAAVEKFNTENKWKKRGLRTSFSRWAPTAGQRFDVNLSVYHGDGSVTITHGGVDMGQGSNTLAIQVCAYKLKIDVSKIQIRGYNTIDSPNSAICGGSFTGLHICIAVVRCCDALLETLTPYKAKLTNPTWEQTITEAYNSEADLQVHGFVNMGDSEAYNIYGIACAEVETDILTGQFEIIRVDLLQDVGRSVNPEIDIGQVEGAFTMGLGIWTCEKLVYDKQGQLLTDRTWNYHVPQARDIPQDFRIYLKKKSFSTELLLGSKATGEPPLCLSVVVPLGLMEAIVAARLDSGIPSTALPSIDGPFTTEYICMTANAKTENYLFTA